jgi:single-stranded-DNA-specific exonuclease
MDAVNFINPSLRNLMPDPLSFTNMQEAASRIIEAYLKKEQVAIFGDYDVDGACSSAILSLFFKKIGVKHDIYIPNRITEGYGPNTTAIRNLIRKGARLIITVDCGANNTAVLSRACQEGADIIVLDHHTVYRNTLQSMDWVQVNPNRPDDLSGQGHLCAAGVVFITLAAVSRQLKNKQCKNIPDLLDYLDLVALATICDIVPLQGVNRAFVSKGLEVAHNMRNIGLTALAQASCIREPLNTFHLGYLLGPRLNAGGRIGNPALGAKLLISDNYMEARTLATRLNELNQNRKEMETDQVNQAEIQIANEIQGNNNISDILIASGPWHPGIVGLIAARLKERFNRPALAIAITKNGIGIGSARSIAGINIGDMISSALSEGVLENGGGHAMAAGLTINAQKINQLKIWFTEHMTKIKHPWQNHSVLLIDGILSADESPIFVLPYHKLVDVRKIGIEHISVSLAKSDQKILKGIAFRALDTALGDFLLAKRMRTIHVAARLMLNSWNGKITPQIHICDAAEPFSKPPHPGFKSSISYH